jgi:hypothetical protein
MSRMVELYLHSRICVLGVVLNYVIKHRDNFTFTSQSFLTPVSAAEQIHRELCCERRAVRTRASIQELDHDLQQLRPLNALKFKTIP